MNYPRLRFQIPSSTMNLNVVEKILNDLKNTWNIQEENYFDMMVAVTEAVTNAIVHGNKSDIRKLVSINVFHDRDLCVFSTEDQGEGFDYKTVKNPTLAESLIELGGRGIFIMKKLSRYLRFTKNGSCVKMFFYLKAI